MNSAAAGDVPIPGSQAVARLASDGSSVEVRCGDPSCRRLLYKVEGTAVADIKVSRLCPGRHGNVNCSLMNFGIVTGRRGFRVEDGLPGDWRCVQCDRHLARVHVAKGRVAVRCRCRAVTAATASVVLDVAFPLSHAG